MILRSVELESFGKFRGELFELRRGMNLVIGPNEAGKSTLAEAIPAVLFGTERLERYKPWGRNSCSASLVFEGQGRTVQIKRNLVTDEVQLVERDDMYHVLSQFSGKVPLRGRTAICREYYDLLETLLGVADESLFRATYFFGHHPLEWQGDELARKLRTLISGSAESDYAQILDALLDEHFLLTRENPWGRDKQRDREYEEVCQQLAGCVDEGAVPVFVEIDNLAESREELEALTAELEVDRAECAKGERYIAHLRSQLPPPDVDLPETAAVPSLPGQTEPAADLAAHLVAAGLPPNPPRALPEILAEAATIRQELAEMQRPFSELNSREGRVPVIPWAVLAGGCAAILLAAVLGWWRGWSLLWLGSVAALGLAGLASWALMQHKSRSGLLEKCRKERALLELKKAAALTRQTQLSERCEALGLPTSAIDLVRLQKLVTTHQALLDACWSRSAEGAKASPSAASPVPQPTDVANEPPASSDPAMAELQQLERKLEAFAAMIRQKEDRLAALLRQQSDLTAQQGPPVAQNRQALAQRKRELGERIAVLRKAVDLLAAAVDEYSGSHLLRLNEEVSRLFGKLTGGRHPAVQLDENMAPRVLVDGRRWQPIESFSRGTVDALYLALRIALAKVRGDGRSLPLVLDDPFVHFDQKRLSVALNLVDLSATDGQLILLSHNLELGKRAARERWHVIAVDGETVRPVNEEGGEHAGQLHLL